MAMVSIMRTPALLWPGALRWLWRTYASSSLSSRLLGLQDRWQHLNRIQTDLMETGFTGEALSRSAIPEKHRLLHGSYTALLKSVITDQQSRHKDVIFVFDSICARYRPSKSDLLLMIKWFRDNSDADNAVKILHTMFNSGWPLQPLACNQVIDVVATQSGSKKAKQLFDRLISFGFKPDHYTYSSMINAAAVERNAILAEYWFQQYFDQSESKDNVVVYGALMKAYLRAGLFDKCLSIIDGSFPCQPNVFMFATAIEACRRAKNIGRSIVLFEQMIRQGISPTIKVYNQLIGGTASVGDMESSMRFYECLKSRGLSPDIVTFTSILNGHLVDLESSMKLTASSPKLMLLGRNKLSNTARSLLSEATLKYGLVPDLAMYTTMVNIFTLTGHLTDALLCLTDLLIAGIRPDLKLFSAILSCLAQHGSYHQCRNLYYTMLRVGIAPNRYCYQSIISSLRKRQAFPMMGDIVDAQFDILGNHPSCVSDVFYFIEEMRARDITPDLKLYCTIMQVLGRADQVELCIRVFVKAVRSHPNFSHENWCLVIAAAIRFLSNPASKSLFLSKIRSFVPFSEDMYTCDLKRNIAVLSQNENKR